MADRSKGQTRNDGDDAAALQVIVLGAGGGPMEDNCTAFLVRSTSLKWTRGSVLAVDTGVHLSAIEQLLQQYYPLPPGRPHTLREGVLAGLELPHQNIGANTAHIARNIVGAHLLTHPHLDHISGGVISTALASTRPMIIAGLASTIEALKNHIFNDVIWPNLSDENGGVGLVTFMRLISGGSSVLGDGITQGYMEAVEGLGVKSWAISHGNCIGDFPYQDRSSNTSTETPRSPRSPNKRLSPQTRTHHSFLTSPDVLSQITENLNLTSKNTDRSHVYTSSAFFIHDVASGREILIWGDVEPDTISGHPRNRQVWIDAAPKILNGSLKAIFIECSFEDNRPDDMIFGHLTPRHLMEELNVLANEVDKCREAAVSPHKRGSDRGAGTFSHIRSSSALPAAELSYLRRTISARLDREWERRDPGIRPLSSSLGQSGSLGGAAHFLESKPNPLQGVKVVIIHLKDKMDDGEKINDVVLREILDHEKTEKLGCEFLVSYKGMSVDI